LKYGGCGQIFPKASFGAFSTPFIRHVVAKIVPKETLILTYAMDFYGNKIPNITNFQTRKENTNHQISIRVSNQFFLFW